MSLVSDSEKEETGSQAIRGRNSLPHEDKAKLTFNSISKRTADTALIEIKKLIGLYGQWKWYYVKFQLLLKNRNRQFAKVDDIFFNEGGS